MNGRDLAITFGDKEQVVVAASVLDNALSSLDAPNKFLSAAAADDRAFVAFFDEYGEKYSLLCIDRKSGKVLWKEQVWALATEQIPARTGPWGHALTMVLQNRSVVLLGIGVGCYIESFDIATGKPLYRFSSNTWNARRDTD
jgi:hypothetical protein